MAQMTIYILPTKTRGCAPQSPGISRFQKGAGGKEPRQKTSKIVKKCQKVFSALFDNFCAGQKTSKIVKKRQNVFRHFSTIFARHHFSGPFWGLQWKPTKMTKMAGVPQTKPPFAKNTVLARQPCWGCGPMSTLLHLAMRTCAHGHARVCAIGLLGRSMS